MSLMLGNRRGVKEDREERKLNILKKNVGVPIRTKGRVEVSIFSLNGDLE